MAAPQHEYSRRLEERKLAGDGCDRWHFVLGNARFAVVVAGVAMMVAVLGRGWLSGWWLLLPLVLFFGIGGRLQRLEGERARLARAESFYQRALERLDGRWAGAGESGLRFLDDEHLYARDLDVFGTGSLFELLCQARTRMGEETLARWLLAPASPGVLAQRQAASSELAPRLNLREDIAVLGEDASAGVHADELAAWGEAPPALASSGFRWFARGLSLLGILTMVAAVTYLAVLSGDLQLDARASTALRVFFLTAVLAFGMITWRFNARAEAIFLGAELAARDVGLLAAVLERLERESFISPRLAALRAELDTDGQPPSRRIARLNRLMEFVYQRDNMVVRFIGPFILWDVHLAYALEDWRAASGAGMRRWLSAVGEIEALTSIAAYHYERPDDVFAELSEGAPEFTAEAISHPLLSADEAVPNEVALGGDVARVLLVSGSNMSGKSTLLRTIGVSAVFAQAGVPVRATGLRLSPLVVGASIRLMDSLQDGESRFYAEILRLREIVRRAGEADVAESGGGGRDHSEAGNDPDGRGHSGAGNVGETTPPVLFLIDEFLHGTNSHDRRIGAEAIVHGLADRGAIGLVTTHDLALTHIADTLGERGANVHFADHLADGKMRFDYRMRAGVVEKSNALELMRSVGLDV